MPISLSDLRSSPPSARDRDERATTICLKPSLVAEVQSLNAELEALPAVAPEPGEGEERQGPPRRMGESGEHPRAAEIRARLRELLDDMAEHEGEMRVRANLTDGEWRQWVDEHPARDEGQPGHERDLRWTGGYCDADALVDNIGLFVYSWNGDPLQPGDWSDIFSPTVSLPDKGQMATAVVSMYESVTDFPRWRLGLSAALNRSSGSASRAPSASATDDSTAGSPEPSRSATTETASA